MCSMRVNLHAWTQKGEAFEVWGQPGLYSVTLCVDRACAPSVVACVCGWCSLSLISLFHFVLLIPFSGYSLFISGNAVGFVYPVTVLNCVLVVTGHVSLFKLGDVPYIGTCHPKPAVSFLSVCILTSCSNQHFQSFDWKTSMPCSRS